MLEGMWWVIVTVSTVGYGDITPKTSIGRLIGVFTICFGLIIFSMPLSIIGANFDAYLEQEKEAKRLKEEAKKSKSSKVINNESILSNIKDIKYDIKEIKRMMDKLNV